MLLLLLLLISALKTANKYSAVTLSSVDRHQAASSARSALCRQFPAATPQRDPSSDKPTAVGSFQLSFCFDRLSISGGQNSDVTVAPKGFMTNRPAGGRKFTGSEDKKYLKRSGGTGAGGSS